jgi:hypothetical protein
LGTSFFDHVSRERVNHVPVVLLERREVNDLSVRRESHAVAAAFVCFFPDHLLCEQVDALERFDGTDVEALRGGARADALDVQRFAVLIHAFRGNAFDEFVIVVDVEHEEAVPAELEIIADARHRHVEVSLVRRPLRSQS